MNAVCDSCYTPLTHPADDIATGPDGIVVHHIRTGTELFVCDVCLELLDDRWVA